MSHYVLTPYTRPFNPTSSSAIANQESLSGLEIEMRKLEGLVKEIVDELDYLKKREERFANTNRTPPCPPSYTPSCSRVSLTSLDE